MEERKVVLQLKKPHYEKYLMYLFDQSTGTIRINRSNEAGKYLSSRVRYSDLPVQRPEGITIDLLMPSSELDGSKSHFLYYSPEDTQRINDFLSSSSALDFSMMVHVGTNELNIDRKTVISIFSGIMFDDDKYEMLKKKEYRKRLKTKDFLVKSIKTLGYQ